MDNISVWEICGEHEYLTSKLSLATLFPTFTISRVITLGMHIFVHNQIREMTDSYEKIINCDIYHSSPSNKKQFYKFMRQSEGYATQPIVCLFSFIIVRGIFLN